MEEAEVGLGLARDPGRGDPRGLARSIIFYDFPAWVFIAAYVGFALLVGATFLIVPVKKRMTAAPASSAAAKIDKT